MLEFAERLEPSSRLRVVRGDEWLYDSIPGDIKVKDGRNYSVISIKPMSCYYGVEVEVVENDY